MDETNVNPAQAEPVTEVPERDFAAEAEALIEARPELRGKPLPDGVLRTALEDNQPLLRAYLDHEQPPISTMSSARRAQSSSACARKTVFIARTPRPQSGRRFRGRPIPAGTIRRPTPS